MVRRCPRVEEQFVVLSDRRVTQLYGSLEKSNKARARNAYRPERKTETSVSYYVIGILKLQ